MTPETRTSLTTAVLVVVPVVAAIAAFAYFGPGSHGTRFVSNCSDLTTGTYWGLEFDNTAGTSGNPAYVLATIDLSGASRGGLKHNVEVNWKTLHAGSYATETTAEYDFDPASNCTNNGTVLSFQPDNNAPSLTVTLTGNGNLTAQGGNPAASWRGSIAEIP
jgi:hypothetical protein